MRFWATALLLGLIAGTSAAWGQALLKLQGSSFAPIRQKSLDLRARFDGPVATTTLDMVYFNPAHSRTEADFVFTVPEGSVVTGFAYWYKREKVVARIVDKERASVIYNAIKSFRRDPALVELIGKRTFRARIFPVEQRSDLRIEMTVVSTSRDGSFTFPVRVAKDQPIENAVVTVEGTPPIGTVAVSNSFGASDAFENGKYTLRIEGKQWRPSENLRVGFKARNTGLRVVGGSAPGTDAGYFTLLVSNDRAVAKPRLSVSGKAISDVHIEKRAGLKPGHTLLVTGRYRGSGRLHVTLQGQGVSGQTSVDLAAGGDKAALSRLWALDEIESLGRSQATEARVRSLSKTYLLPSPYTSWLAIPESERKAFDLEIRAANAVILATRLAEDLKRGATRKSVESRLLSKIGKEPKDVRDRALNVLDGAAYEIVNEMVQKATTAWDRRLLAGRYPGASELGDQSRITARARELGLPPQDWRIESQGTVQEQLASVYRRIAADKLQESAATREARRLKSWFLLGEPKGSWPHFVSWVTNEDVYEYQRDVLANGRATERGQRLRSRVERATDWLLGDRTLLTRANTIYEAQNVARDLARLRLDGQGESERATSIKDRLDGFAATFPWFKAEATVHAQFKGEALQRSMKAIPSLGEAVRKTGIGDPGTKAALDEAERYRQLSESPTYIGHLANYGWFEPANNVVEEARASLLSGRPVDEVRSDVERQKARLAEAKFSQMLKDVEAQLKSQLDEEAYGIAAQTWRANPDESIIQEHEKALRCFADLLRVDPEPYLRKLDEPYYGEEKRWAFLKELRRTDPDPAKVAALREDFRDQNPDWRGQEWINWRIERIETDAMLDKLEKTAMTPELERQVVDLKKKSEELRARMGDPTISVKLPPGTQTAEARFPWGQSQLLKRDPVTGLWEAKFDVPLYAGAGPKDVQVVHIGPDGRVSVTIWRFTVDLTAPKLKVQSEWRGSFLTIVVEGPVDLARVKAVVPWAQPVTFERIGPGRFTCIVTPPEGWSGRLTVVAFDKAHNRSDSVVHVHGRS